VCETVRSIIATHPNVDARLVICPEKLGINAKVSTLIQLRREAIHPVLIVSDADVKIQNGVLASLVAPLDQPHVGLVNCFYRLANPTTVAMKWEAVCINVDFWSQVLQSITLKPQDFALGAAMSFRNTDLAQIGGFEGLADHLADDYQLGHRLARQGLAVQLATTVVECWDSPADWAAVWSHQLRWNRTIRVCQPGPYAASIVANLTLWTGLWCVSRHDWTAVTTLAGILGLRMVLASILARRISRGDRVDEALALGLLAPLKDVLGGAVWLAALFGHRVIWRGVAYTVQADGRLIPAES
jgi:ceramide glucosyltransferase